MTWFKRQKKGILTNLSEQNDVPEGQWIKCPNCTEIINRRELQDHLFVCPTCSHHFNIPSLTYFEILYDDGQFVGTRRVSSSNQLSTTCGSLLPSLPLRRSIKNRRSSLATS